MLLITYSEPFSSALPTLRALVKTNRVDLNHRNDQNESALSLAVMGHSKRALMFLMRLPGIDLKSASVEAAAKRKRYRNAWYVAFKLVIFQMRGHLTPESESRRRQLGHSRPIDIG